MGRPLPFGLGVIAAALMVAACGGGARAGVPSTSSGGVALSTKSVKGLGTVLVNGQGRTVYTFAPDDAKKVTCTGSCATVWPPLKIAAGHKPALSGAVNGSLVSSDPDPSGGRVVTYNGWPLYLYQADPMPGTDNGQAVKSAGGFWYVITPSGAPLKKHVKNGTKPPHY